MRLFLSVFVFSLMLPFAGAQESLQLQTKMDPELKSVLEVLSNALVGRLPQVHKDTRVNFLDNSNVSGGQIQAEYDLKLKGVDGEAAVSSRGQMTIQLSPLNQDNVKMQLITRGELVTADLIKTLTDIQSSLCTENCSLQALQDPSEASLPLSQQGEKIFNRFKQNLITYLNSASTDPNEGRKRQTFGGGSPASSSSSQNAPVIAPELAQQLITVIQNSVVISQENNQAVMSLNLADNASLASELNKINPALSLVFSFETVKIAMGDQSTSYELIIENTIPARAVQTYDAFLTREQRNNALRGLAELVKKIGPWAVGRCAHEEYQSICMDQLLYSCARDVGAVDWCVFSANALQAARETQQQVDAFGQGMQDAGKQTVDFFSWVISGGQQPQE